MMMHAQYCRIESIAGGCHCTNREFIRACHSRLNKLGKSHARREWRHAWIREGIQQLDNARALVRHYRF